MTYYSAEDKKMKDDFDVSKLIRTKKKRINSRTKGNTFENKICKILNEKFNTTDFMRSPGSGAFATSHKLPEHLQIHGDLITPKNFRFTIECKKGYNKESLSSVFNPKSNLISFIEQAETDAKKENKDFILVFAQDRQPIIILINSKILYTYEVDIKISIKIKEEEYTMMLLDDLLRYNNNFFYNL